MIGALPIVGAPVAQPLFSTPLNSVGAGRSAGPRDGRCSAVLVVVGHDALRMAASIAAIPATAVPCHHNREQPHS